MAIATFPEVIHIALINDLTPQTPRFRTDIDDIIRRTDNLLIMLHHDHGIPQGLQLSQYLDQQIRIPGMQTDTRLIQNIQRTHQATTQRGSQIDTLALSSG